jgi:hypothetical protein
MTLLLGYLVSLVATFVIGAMIFTMFLSVTTAGKVRSHPHQSLVAQVNRHEPNKVRSGLRVARVAAEDKSTFDLADAGRDRVPVSGVTGRGRRDLR